MTKRSTNSALVLIVGVAFVIRFWGIWNVSTTDEYNEVIEALRVCSGHINVDRWIKRLYLYVLAFEYGLFFVVGWIADVFQNPLDFAEKIVRNMEPLFLIARFTSVLAGTATVWLLYKTAESNFNRRTALIASVLMTFTAFHIDLSQQAKVDALLGLLVTATFFFLFRLLSSESKGKMDFAWCGFFMALAVQTKINSAVLIFPFLTMLAMTYKDARFDVAKLVGIFVCGFLVGFVLGNPPVVVAPFRFLANVYSQKKVFDTAVNAVPSEVVGFLAYPLFYYKALGPLVTLITVFALLRGIFHPDKRTILILSFIVPFFLLMGSLTSLVAPYYLIPITPVLFLLVGDSLDALYERTLKVGLIAQPILRGVAGIFSCAVAVAPVLGAAEHAISLDEPNTRFLARDWIEAHVPAGSKILMDSGKSINSFAPPIPESKANLAETIRKAKENIRQGRVVHEMVDQNALVYYELLMKTAPENAYDITSTMFGLQVQTVDYYVQNGYSYFIISKWMKDSRSSDYAKKYLPDAARFYGALDSDSRLVLEIAVEPSSTRRGDTFLIYRVTRR